LEGKHPFLLDSMTEKEVISKLLEFKTQGYAQVVGETLEVEKVALDLLKRLLHTKKSQRIRSKEAVAHPFLTGEKVDENVLGKGNEQNRLAFKYDCNDLLRKAVISLVFASATALATQPGLCDGPQSRRYRAKLHKVAAKLDLTLKNHTTLHREPKKPTIELKNLDSPDKHNSSTSSYSSSSSLKSQK